MAAISDNTITTQTNAEAARMVGIRMAQASWAIAKKTILFKLFFSLYFLRLEIFSRMSVPIEAISNIQATESFEESGALNSMPTKMMAAKRSLLD